MPFLYLSPSTQQFNPYITGGNEEYWMNLIADAMEPYLRASGVNFTRNDPSTSAAAAIRESNRGNYDFHLALHSNAAGDDNSGNQRGIDVYYYPSSADGLTMANLLVKNLKTIYPLPNRVRAVPTTTIGEIRRTKAPAVLAELGYHDNVQDASWIEGNVNAIAEEIARSVTEYFALPFIEPIAVRQGTITASGGLNLRSYPTVQSASYLLLPPGAQVSIYGRYGDWFTAGYNGVTGFVSAAYIAL